jgi:hypothetical protein
MILSLSQWETSHLIDAEAMSTEAATMDAAVTIVVSLNLKLGCEKLLDTRWPEPSDFIEGL